MILCTFSYTLHFLERKKTIRIQLDLVKSVLDIMHTLSCKTLCRYSMAVANSSAIFLFLRQVNRVTNKLSTTTKKNAILYIVYLFLIIRWISNENDSYTQQLSRRWSRRSGFLISLKIDHREFQKSKHLIYSRKNIA